MIYSSFPVCCLNSAEPIINGSLQGVGVPLACIVGSNLQVSRPDWSTLEAMATAFWAFKYYKHFPYKNIAGFLYRLVFNELPNIANK